MSLLDVRSVRPRPPRASMLSGSDEPGLVGRRYELDTVERLVEDARTGRSGVLIVRGEPGIGKSVLLDDVARRAQGFVIARVAGVESEMELAYAALQQLCRPFGEGVPNLPAMQRDALNAAFGLSAGPPRDRYLV